jgi:HlyD family secretion protein
MICDIHLDAIPGRHWGGRIESLTSVANRKGFASQHKVFRAVVQPDSIDTSVMKPGMTARLEFTVSLGSGVLGIPRDYLGLDLAGQYYVLKGPDRKTAKVQVVKVGRFSDHMVEILSGLATGDEILALHRAPAEEVKS